MWKGGVYAYEIVIHKYEFMSAADPSVHKNNAENLKMHVKGNLKLQFETTDKLFM